jgi:hypothetical protein
MRASAVLASKFLSIAMICALLLYLVVCLTLQSSKENPVSRWLWPTAVCILRVMERKPVRLWHLARRLGLIWVALPLVFSVVLGGVGLSLWAKSALLAREGVVIEGLVLDKRIERRSTDNGDELIYILRYEYLPPDRLDPIVKRANVSRSRYQKTEVGNPIEVTYVWSQPETASIDPRGDRFGAVIFSLFGAVAALVTGGLGWWLIGRKISVIRALRAGEVREARVTALRQTNVLVNKVPLFVLDWVDAAGQTGTSLMAGHTKLSRYPVGSVIVVYIDPQTGRGWWDVQI